MGRINELSLGHVTGLFISSFIHSFKNHLGNIIAQDTMLSTREQTKICQIRHCPCPEDYYIFLGGKKTNSSGKMSLWEMLLSLNHKNKRKNYS